MKTAAADESTGKPPETAVRQQQRLVQALQSPDCYQHETGTVELIETHISWILLTGSFAYKILKPLQLAFLDFSTLERRRRCCNEEIRLNSRTAPDLYLGVAEISGSPEAPQLNANGTVIEYAVKMLQFDQKQRLDNVLAGGGLERRHLKQLAKDMADMHRQAAIAGPESGFATPARLRADALENFDTLTAVSTPGLDQSLLGELREWTELELKHLEAAFEARREQGFIRECHGDLHLENLVLHHNRVQAFDCIEFNENFRWIDVISDAAFLIMDLDYQERADLSQEFINSYLEYTGDFAGLALVRFYQVYRAMVRAKVAAIRMQQARSTPESCESERGKLIGHLQLAARYARGHGAQSLIISQGLSGSGKSWLAGEIAVRTGAIRIRSDVERKRCNTKDFYSATATRNTYRRLAQLARIIISAGYSVIVDATFLQLGQRLEFRALARHLGLPFLIVQTTAQPEILEQRIRDRREDPSEATLEVLARQRACQEFPGGDEVDVILSVDTGDGSGIETIVERIHKRLETSTG